MKIKGYSRSDDGRWHELNESEDPDSGYLEEADIEQNEPIYLQSQPGSPVTGIPWTFLS